jgi:hypothetical protein
MQACVTEQPVASLSFFKANGFWPRSIKRLRLFVQSEVSPVNAGTWR